MIDIGQAMRETREDMGLSIYQLEILSGVDHSLIQRYETGKVLPGIQKLILLANALDTPIDDYIGRRI